MKGSCATFRSCWRAASSSGTPLVHALMGTPLSGLITLNVASVIVSSLLRSTNLVTNSGRGGEIRTPDLVRPRHAPSTKLGHSPNLWWLVTELNRVHRLFRPALYRRVHEPNLVDGARLELASHGCRPWIIPLYEPPIWGEMRESNSRDWSHNPVPKPFGQSRHNNLWSW